MNFNHPLNPPNRRAKSVKPRATGPSDPRVASFNLTLEEKCAWMREKQAREKAAAKLRGRPA